MSGKIRLVTYALKISQTSKFKHFLSPSLGNQHVGTVLDSGDILDLGNMPFGMKSIQSMHDIIKEGSDYIKKLKSKIYSDNDLTGGSSSGFVIGRESCDILAPIPLPRRNVICIGKNYMDHIAEVSKKDKGTTETAKSVELPKYPQIFTKAPHCVVGPNAPIESHKNITNYLDYEAELAVIIGTEGKNIPKEKAMDYVYGYTIANDVTARDIQRHHGQWFKGKTLDSSCPMGPYLIPKDEIPNVKNLDIKLWLNNDLMQNSNTSKMIFDIPEIIHQLSKGFTLRQGDIILTGTPDGVGYARNPVVALKPGDKIKIEIQDIGILENMVIP